MSSPNPFGKWTFHPSHSSCLSNNGRCLKLVACYFQSPLRNPEYIRNLQNQLSFSSWNHNPKFAQVWNYDPPFFLHHFLKIAYPKQKWIIVSQLFFQNKIRSILLLSSIIFFFKKVRLFHYKSDKMTIITFLTFVFFFKSFHWISSPPLLAMHRVIMILKVGKEAHDSK